MSTINIFGEDVLIGKKSISLLCKKISMDNVECGEDNEIVEHGRESSSSTYSLRESLLSEDKVMLGIEAPNITCHPTELLLSEDKVVVGSPTAKTSLHPTELLLSEDKVMLGIEASNITCHPREPGRLSEDKVDNGIYKISLYLPKSVIGMLNTRELFYLLQKLDEPLFFFDFDDIFGKEIGKTDILANNYNYGIIFDVDKTIMEIFGSYCDYILNCLDNPTRIKIFDQFLIDFPRMQLYINFYKCESINLFQNLMSKYKQYSHSILKTVFDLIVMLCTQASFYYPYNIVHTLYSLPKYEIYVIPSTDPPCINIIENTSSIEIIFKKMFKFFDTKTEKTLLHFSTYFVVTIDLVSIPDGYIFYGKKYGVCSSITSYWFNDKNLVIV